VRHAHGAPHHERLQQPHREQVVGGEHRIGPFGRGPFADPLTGRPSLQHGECLGLDDFERRVGGVRDRASRPLEAIADLADAHRASDERDAAAPGLNEVASRELTADDIVDGDG
jgi:hypothetical protein